MSDNYYLKHVNTHKVDKYTYEYDKFEDSMSNGSKYCVDIVFENDQFNRLDFGDNKRKRFDDNLRLKELDLINKIQKEIENIKENREKEKFDVIKIKLKPTQEQIELINAMVGESEQAKISQSAFKSWFGPVLSIILDKLSINKIPFNELKTNSIKVKIPLEYEIEIFNPNLGAAEEQKNK